MTIVDVQPCDERESTSHRTFETYGVRIGVRANDPSLLDRVPQCLPPGWTPASSPAADVWYSIRRREVDGGLRTHYELLENDEKLAEGFRLSRLLDAMDSAVRLQVGVKSPDRLFVHAGAVVWNGRAIVIPGRSGAGKTSLVVALVKAGALYGSDEYAVLDDRGWLHPYARPISRRQGAHRRETLRAEADLGGRAATVPVPVGLMVHTHYRPDAEWSAHVVSPGESALALFANVLAARQRPAFAYSVLSNAVLNSVSLRSDRGDAGAAAAAILRYADGIHSSTEGT